MRLDCTQIRHVIIHKEQFDAIEKNAYGIMLGCFEDGRCIAFHRFENTTVMGDANELVLNMKNLSEDERTSLIKLIEKSNRHIV